MRDRFKQEEDVKYSLLLHQIKNAFLMILTAGGRAISKHNGYVLVCQFDIVTRLACKQSCRRLVNL